MRYKDIVVGEIYKIDAYRHELTNDRKEIIAGICIDKIPKNKNETIRQQYNSRARSGKLIENCNVLIKFKSLDSGHSGDYLHLGTRNKYEDGSDRYYWVETRDIKELTKKEKDKIMIENL